jgi:hypothetical protein
MAWSITGNGWADADWSAVATVNQFISAVNERWLAAGLSAALVIPAVVAGDDVQRGELWRTLQERVAALCAYFVQSHAANGTAYADDHYEGLAASDASTFLPVWNSADAWQAAGLYVDAGTYGFRRATTAPTDWTSNTDPAYSRGYVQWGDIIGPWIFRDLQAMLNLLVWTQTLQNTSPGEHKLGVAPDQLNQDWAAAKAIAEADYDACTPISGGGVGDADVAAYTRGYTHQDVTYEAEMWRGRSQHRVDLPAHCKRTIDWYCLGLPINYVTDPPRSFFDANGDAVQNGQWHCWSSETPGTPAATETSTAWLGALARPAWCDLPVGGTLYLGYRAWFAALIRWNIAGGFAYC